MSVVHRESSVRFSARELVPLLARIAIAGVFLWASLPKLADPGAFAADVQNYRVLPDALVGHAALFVPAFELVVAIGLLLPRYQRGAALIATSMLAIFSLAMAQARLRGIDLSCGCFGAAFEAKVSWLTVIRSAALGLLSAVPLIFPKRALKTEQPAT
jgi:putative oxidoreductase